MLTMGRRLDAFPGERPPGRRKYPWDEWTDRSAWEIRRGEDYDVATENMRVNLHMKADSLRCKVRTRKFEDDDQVEGLIFQFFDFEREAVVTEHSDSTRADTELLYRDALEIYERARREVTIPWRDGRRGKYAAVRYKQQIERAHAAGQLVSAIGRLVSRPTEGFGHLEEAERPDLMVETLVIDAARPYHQLFPTATVQMARERMAQYWARHPKPPS